MEKNDHNYGKIFDEIYCKNMIANYYQELPIFTKHESPDFVSDDTCLEIRKALNQETGELHNFFSKYINKDYSLIPKSVLNGIGFDQDPVPFNDKNIFYIQKRKKDNSMIEYMKTKEGQLILVALFDLSIYNDEYQSIIDSVKEKLNKLNSNYCSKEINILGIICYECINYTVKELKDNIINSILENVKMIKNTNKQKNFDYIYIVFMDSILRIDVNTMEYDVKDITSKIRSLINEKTIKEVNAL